MRSSSRPVFALILSHLLLILATGCTSDEGAAVKVNAPDPELSSEGDSLLDLSTDVNADDSLPFDDVLPVEDQNSADSTENTVSIPPDQPPEQQIPQALKDAPIRKIVQQFPDKTTHREFTAKVVGKGYVYHGLYTEYYPGGGKQKSGQYEYSRKNGEWTFWGKNGVVRKKGTYVNDKQDGEWYKHRDDGSLEWIERYSNGLTHGTWKRFQADGKTVVWERPYVNGKRHGLWVNYYPNGSKGSIETYKDGKLEGPAKAWFDSGTLKMEGQYVDGQRHGTFRAFGATGNLRDEVVWEHGNVKVGS